MRNIKEILRLQYEVGLSRRAIARSCNVSHSTVSDILERAEAADLSWPLSDDLSDSDLVAMLYPKLTPESSSMRTQMPTMTYLFKELKRKGVTLQLLWHEYKLNYPNGYQYSRFCELYRNWLKKSDPSLRRKYYAGEVVLVDWAGMTMNIVDRNTGEVSDAHIFVACLGASDYTFAKAYKSEGLENWIAAHVHAFNFFGGVPKLIIPDNPKTATLKYCFYEPELNQTYLDMATHYRTAVIPARPRKPKDKSKVEGHVLIVERSVLAPLRNITFFSINELNEAIDEKLYALNNKPFQKLEGTRYSVFMDVDKPALNPLPPSPYEFALWKKVKLNIDYHFEFDSQLYSCPHQLIGETLDISATQSIIEIFYKGKRIDSHVRTYGKRQVSTKKEHMPSSHRRYAEWTPSRMINWAKKVGPNAAEFVEAVLESKPHPEQGFRSCLGIINLAKKYPEQRVDSACRRALVSRAFTYRSVKSILEKGLDKVPFDVPTDNSPIVHKNIRGSEYYQN